VTFCTERHKSWRR